ncbi:MAG: methylenetetrahydrofolate--tRNA-(uracil-5-)-methyltransferase [Clostridia bacterium]|nr:methylenetetrahydrofolate--tRNA-(uracil-5-)-methyltransferase [Clostridia bacterium]MDN5322919.1 methylenetetrahydrofolate--tRNA-(uracil-5-)-methyltransferase [Clostridia bacterium]
MVPSITVVGAGLAGCEAAWQIAQQGINVNLFEMRPYKTTPAHKTQFFGELVCSNSLRGAGLENAVGLLKEELRICNSIFMECADLHKIPAGGALAVDREEFARCLTEKLSNHPLINVYRREVTHLENDTVYVIATGPLTEGKMAEIIKKLTGEDYFYFYDAAAPIVTAESINYEKAFWASRYNKGDADYLNCPMTKDEYENFYYQLINAQLHPLETFEKQIFFEGCMPVEVMASRGKETLLFGPLKPVGLIDPKTKLQPYAVVQLRKDNKEGTLLNMVGFQTRLKWGEQKRVFSLIPGLENAEFVRYGVMHRNTFINSPKVLEETGQLKEKPHIFFAGQITGVEGYVESATGGLVAGINAGRFIQGKNLIRFPQSTAIGSLMKYITKAESKTFQPMNINFGLLPALNKKIKNKREKNKQISQRALLSLKEFIKERGIGEHR